MNRYKLMESTTGGENVVPPETWDAETVKQWILDQANDIHSGKVISAAKDLFEQGFDR
jgi:hypothetical protein